MSDGPSEVGLTSGTSGRGGDARSAALVAAGGCGACTGGGGSDYPWNQHVDAATRDADSNAIIPYLHDNDGGSARFHIGIGTPLLTADAATPRESFEPSSAFLTPDCDMVAVPVPAGGAVSGEASYVCEHNGDCQLVVINYEECLLYEMWRTNRTSSSFEGGCLAVWDLTATYSPTLRGDCCASPSLAGLPIAALTPTADEIASGIIHHAIRFALPDSLIKQSTYVRPATFAVGVGTTSAYALPMGARLRLISTFDDSDLNAAARVFARALREYGMILTDSGSTTFRVADDRFTVNKWDGVGLGPTDLTSLQWTDFEVVQLGTRYDSSDCTCERTPLSE